MKKTIILIALAASTAACTMTPTAPVVSDYNGSSVKIQISGHNAYLSEPEREGVRQAANLEATRVCKAGGKRLAEHVSTRTQYADAYGSVAYYERLYICH